MIKRLNRLGRKYTHKREKALFWKKWEAIYRKLKMRGIMLERRRQLTRKDKNK